MWRQMARIISEVRPRYAFMENSPLLVSRGLAVVLGDLAAIGYDAEWCCLSAGELGANHERDRIWIFARSNDADADVPQCQGGRVSCGIHAEDADAGNSCWWQNSSGIPGMDDGVAARVDRLVAGGNGQVPVVAAVAFEYLKRRFERV